MNASGECGRGSTASEQWETFRHKRPANFVFASDAARIKAFHARESQTGQPPDDEEAVNGEDTIDVGSRLVKIKDCVLFDPLGRDEHTPEVSAQQAKLLRLNLEVGKVDDKVAVFALLPRRKETEKVWDSYSKQAKKRCIDECVQIHVVRLVTGSRDEEYRPAELNVEYEEYVEHRYLNMTRRNKYIMSRYEWGSREIDGALLEMGCGCCNNPQNVGRQADSCREGHLANFQLLDRSRFAAR